MYYDPSEAVLCARHDETGLLVRLSAGENLDLTWFIRATLLLVFSAPLTLVGGGEAVLFALTV